MAPTPRAGRKLVPMSSNVAIETQGLLTAGMTVIDQRDLKEVPDPNCDLLVGIEADAAWQVVVDSIAHFSR